MKSRHQCKRKPENAGIEKDRKKTKGNKVDWQQQQFEHWSHNAVQERQDYASNEHGGEICKSDGWQQPAEDKECDERENKWPKHMAIVAKYWL